MVLSNFDFNTLEISSLFQKTLRIHALGILAWYDHEISTGPLEGTNNKIKTLKRQAYGFRDLEFFKLRIYASSGTAPRRRGPCGAAQQLNKPLNNIDNLLSM